MLNRWCIVAIALLLAFGINGYAIGESNTLYRADSKEEIVKRVTDAYGFARTISINTKEKEAFVVLGQWTSAETKLIIFFYLYEPESKDWTLFLFRVTNASKVSVRIEDGNILFYSEKNKLLLLQPIETLTMD